MELGKYSLINIKKMEKELEKLRQMIFLSVKYMYFNTYELMLSLDRKAILKNILKEMENQLDE